MAIALRELRHRQFDQPYFAILVLVGVSILFQYVVVHGSFVQKHYQYIASAPLSLMAGFGIKSLTSRMKITHLLVSVLALQVVWSIPVAAKLWKDSQSDFVRNVSRTIREETLPEDAIVVMFPNPSTDESSDLSFFANSTAPFIFYLSDRRGITIYPDSGINTDPNYLLERGFTWIVRIDAYSEGFSNFEPSFSLSRIKAVGN